jgi:hypothetical protein
MSILYSIGRNCDNDLWVYVTPKHYWEQLHCQDDTTPKEAMEAIKDFGFLMGEAMEGVIEVYDEGIVPASDVTELALDMFLRSDDLFEFNNDFDQFIKECYD